MTSICTAFGHWGDVFVSCGAIVHALREMEETTADVLYVGPHVEIAQWLRMQRFVRNVMAIEITNDGGEYFKFWRSASDVSQDKTGWLSLLKDKSGYDPKFADCMQTHVNNSWFMTDSESPKMWTGGILPECALEWAFCTVAQIRETCAARVYHVHPISTWSESLRHHWQYWDESIAWLVENTPHCYIVTGQCELPWLPASNRIVNLVGGTPTNEHVLAISEYCDGTICTPNNVAIWSAIQSQKSLVVGNNAIASETNYYRRFISSGKRTTFVDVSAKLPDFVHAAEEWISQ